MKETNDKKASSEKALPERIQVAAATEEAPSPEPETPKPLSQTMHIAKGREGGGASESGVLNFEAKSHELGEYMLEVRRRVERQWHAAIQLRYQGVKRAQAVIACSIRPNGTLEYARIEESGDSMTFAIVCKDALERAAPFPKLPFDVPEIYRNENIVIRWKFSYM